MKQAFQDMCFRHEWRKYQKRALNQLDQFINDNKIHIVAAPGAGKTVLGLEIIRRLGRKALVLAPTTLICDQWLQRLQSDFLAGAVAPWAARSPVQDAELYICSYQYFYLHYKEFADCFDVLVLDEAHHLRNAWWEAIFASLAGRDKTVLSLTATPPIDAEDDEWQRYYALCGEIDIEISPPELVQQGDLSPFQDLLYATKNLEIEEETPPFLSFLTQLVTKQKLVPNLTTHDWVKEPRRHATAILDQPEQFVAMISYLRACGLPCPAYASKILGVRRMKWPAFDAYWAGILLTAELNSLQSDIIDELITIKALANDRVAFAGRAAHIKTKHSETQKAICHILNHEREHLADQLCCAILTDHVGKSGFRASKQKGDLSTSSLFHKIWAENPSDDLAVITGTISVLPSAHCTELPGQDMPNFPGYQIIEGATAQCLAIVEKAMRRRQIAVLIGTRSLLGQGWDLPALNTLILATRTTSFVSINQLRGRVMRKDPVDANKAANIWHLADSPTSEIGREDMQAMAKRFSAFAHLFRDEGVIRSGYPAAKSIESLNEQSLNDAKNREGLAKAWQQAFRSDEGKDRYLREITHIEFHSHRIALPMGLIWRLVGALGRGPSEMVNKRTLKRILRASLHSLHQIQRIHTALEDIDFAVEAREGHVSFQVFGATKPEEARIHSVVSDVLGPIKNPRYLIETKQNIFGTGRQLYAMPEAFAKRKELAIIFTQNWRKYVGGCTEIFTRTGKGRALLIAARSNCPATKVEQHQHWS